MSSKRKKFILIFLISLAIGFVVGVFSTHSYFCEEEKLISCDSVL